jgi:subtilisin family serine protease
LAVALITAVPADAGEFVLSAAKWGKKQEAAVLAAGGSVTYSHGKAGVGLVSSANPDFLTQALASNAFQSGAEDVAAQWTPPTQAVEASAITPGDEGFFAYQWNMLAMETPGAWALGCTGAGVRVAILDGGIADTHVDIAANLDVAASTSFVPGQPFNTDTGAFWHGTHVAGIVAAADNGIGTLGVAPEATLIGVKVLHDGSGSFGWIIGGILYAATPQAEGGAGADIINMSLGAVFPKNAVGGGPLVAAMNKVVNYANQHGVLVVSAAGNDYLDLDHSGNLISVPAESGSGIAISATGPVDFALGATNFRRPASYTNFGNSAIHVAAPGGDFVSLNPQWFLDMVLSPGGPGNAYFFAAGTSMASPAAAGVAAIIKQANPGISLGALKSRLAQTADDEDPKGHDPYYGRGFVNAYRACTQ